MNKAIVAACMFALFMAGCGEKPGKLNTPDTPVSGPKPEDALVLPFVGVRDFETRAGVSGTGTPHWSVEIKENRDVVFYYVQVNQGDDDRPETTGKYEAGKFSKYIKCDFKEWDDFPRYYEITKDVIYEVDSNHKRLSLPDCCGLNEYDSTECPCKGELWEQGE